MSVCICGTVKNCAIYLPFVFQNIEKIGKLFEKCIVFLYYDESHDHTLSEIIHYSNTNKNVFYYHNKRSPKAYRTHRLAKGRNTCLDFVRKNCPNYPYFIMMDFDDVCSGTVHTDVLKSYLDKEKVDKWDALTFNKEEYYDIWALSIRPYVFSYLHFENPSHVLEQMNAYVKQRLNDSPSKNDLLECFSAFNGFAIYKTSKFIDCKYDGRIRLDLIPKKYLEENKYANHSDIIYSNTVDIVNCYKEDCEHRFFHMMAKKRNKVKICISPEILFQNP